MYVYNGCLPQLRQPFSCGTNGAGKFHKEYCEVTLKSFKNVSPVIPLKGRIVEDRKNLVIQIIGGLEEGKLCN